MDGSICRAARGYLNWTSRRLSMESGVPVSRIFEVERDRPIDANMVRSLEETFARFSVVPMRQDGELVGIRLSAPPEPSLTIPSAAVVAAELDRVSAYPSRAVINKT